MLQKSNNAERDADEEDEKSLLQCVQMTLTIGQGRLLMAIA